MIYVVTHGQASILLEIFEEKKDPERLKLKSKLTGPKFDLLHIALMLYRQIHSRKEKTSYVEYKPTQPWEFTNVGIDEDVFKVLVVNDIFLPQ